MSSVIEVRNVTKKYADEKVALADLSVDITAGEIIALLGPNGAGKTTLISIICGLTTLTAGNVFVESLVPMCRPKGHPGENGGAVSAARLSIWTSIRSAF